MHRAYVASTRFVAIPAIIAGIGIIIDTPPAERP